MIPFSGIPFLRFTLAFVSGIFFYMFFQQKEDCLLFSFVLLLLYLCLFFLQSRFKKLTYDFSPLLGITALLTLFFAGSSFTYYNDELNDNNHLINKTLKGVGYEAIIVSEPEEKSNSFKVELEVQKLFYRDSTVYTSSHIYLYVSKKKTTQESLSYGDRIIVRGWPKEIEAPVNPFEFDYKRRTKFLHIYHQHVITYTDFKLVSEGEGNLIVAFAFALRKEADKIIRHYVPGKEEQNIASALLLGLKNSLSQELKDVYSSTGTTHVLAVSGMHVTVLCQLLMSMFLLVRSRRFKNFILPVLLLVVLWLYVLVTGFSPSVLRAGVMFSLIIAGNLLERRSNIYNSVLVSAFILLCYDPYMIMDVGFQLSYLAVLGLIFFTNRIYALIEVENKIGDAVWKMLAVSIAAQIITLPLCIYYFHQIPVSALVSNLIAVPISTILLYLGIVLLICSSIPLASVAIGYVFGKLIGVMNSSLEFISSFNMATIKGINLELFQIVLIYIFIFFITVFILRKKYSLLIMSFTGLFLFLISLIVQIIEIKNQQKVVIYNIKNKKVVAFIQGSSAYITGDSIEKDDFKFHIEPSMIAYGITAINQKDITSSVCSYSQPSYDLFVFHKKSFLILKELKSKTGLPFADYILTNRKSAAKLDPERVNEVIVCAGSNKSEISDRYYDMNRMPAMVIHE